MHYLPIVLGILIVDANAYQIMMIIVYRVIINMIFGFVIGCYVMQS